MKQSQSPLEEDGRLILQQVFIGLQKVAKSADVILDDKVINTYGRIEFDLQGS